jgi:hypothetical protein
MSVLKNAAAGAVLGGSLIFTAGLVVANAQPEEPPTEPDGLVTVLVGGSTAQDAVPVEAAGAAAAQVCGGDPAAVAGLAQQVDAEGTERSVCPDVLIVQNVSLPAAAPAEQEVETAAPAVPGGEAPAEAPEGSVPPAVPGEGEADIPFNNDGG